MKFLKEHFKASITDRIRINEKQGGRGIGCDLRPLVKEILLLMSQLHDRGMVHLDIKPCNILVADNGRLALCDPSFCFRPAKRTKNGSIPFRGSDGFMAPEIIMGESVKDACSADMYSLGIMIAWFMGVVRPTIFSKIKY